MRRSSPWALRVATLVLLAGGTSFIALSACSNGGTVGKGQGDADASTGSDGSPADGAAHTPVVDASDAGLLDATTPPRLEDAGDGGGARVQALGYYEGTQGSYDALKLNQASLTMISADVFAVATDGTVSGSDDLNGVRFAQSAGLATYACISNYSDAAGGFDAAIGHGAMVTNKAAAIANILAEAQTGYTGVNIDFESLAYSANIATDRAAYTSFVHQLSAALHAAGRKLILSVPAKTEDAATDTWSYPYDFAALAPDVDWVQLMTYDENGPGWSGPGPVSGADWVKSCLTYATSVVPPSKLLIGLPAYGYDWDLTAKRPSASSYVGTTVPWTGFAAATHGATVHWDATSQTPYADYTSTDGHAHELWYENAQSLKAKAALVTQFHLGGLSVWVLGDDDAGFWQAVYAGL